MHTVTDLRQDNLNSWFHRLSVRSGPFQGSEAGSTPAGTTNQGVVMFKLTSLSAIGAKSLAKQYMRFGYKLVSQIYDEKKQVYISTFK